MKTPVVLLTLTLMAGAALAGQQSRTFTGVISDSMCMRDHAMMKVTPESKCVNDCVKASKDITYTLIVGADEAYALGDRVKPAKFADRKVTVKGVLDEKTNMITVASIEAVR
jgi:hypothetical protein